MRKVAHLFYIIILAFLTACGGVLEVGLDVTATPDLTQKETMQALEARVATLEPLFRPLDLNSSEDDIRQRLLNSHDSWQTIWIDAKVTRNSSIDSGITVERVQVWVDRLTGRFRVVSGPYESTPTRVEISDGSSKEMISLPDGQVTTQPLGDGARNYGWEAPRILSDTIEPHPLSMEISHPVSSAIFSTVFGQRANSLRSIGMEKVAGRPALVVEAYFEGEQTDRFWIDTRTGVLLEWQSWEKGAVRQAPAMEILVNAIELDAFFPSQLFDLQVADVPGYAVDASGYLGPTPEPPKTGYEPGAGEFYFVKVSPGGQPELQLSRLPGNCVIGDDPCPEPQLVSGFPNQDNTIEPLIWSPGEAIAVLVHQGNLYLYQPENEEWTVLAKFSIIQSPVWSLDGKWIAFVAQDTDSHQDIFIVRSDGAELQNLTNGQYFNDNQFLWINGWLGDGRLVFTVMRGIDGRLVAQRIGESVAREISAIELQHGIAIVSPDGHQILFSTQQDGNVSLWQGDIGSEGIQGEGKRLASFQQASVQSLLWSPDGQWVALMVLSSSSPDSYVTTIYAMRSDGTDLRQLYQSGAVVRMQFAGNQHLIAEDGDTGRAVVVPIIEGSSRVLQVPGLQLNQQVRGISWH